MKSLLGLLIIISTGLACATKKHNENIKIVPISILNEIDTFVDDNKVSINRVDYFLVETNEADTAKLYRFIDSFVNVNASVNKSYYDYKMTFYKSSEIINPENYFNDREIINRHLYSEGNPTIASYIWTYGKNEIILKFINGKIINRDSLVQVISVEVDSSKH